MHGKKLNRRRFLGGAAAGAAGLSLTKATLGAEETTGSDSKGSLALLGGKPVRTKHFPSWPVIGTNDREAWSKVLESGRWCRLNGQYAHTFENAYAELTGARHCLATANGTSALITSLNALGIGPGDEVLVPPYTFTATINAVLLQHALPVFVDTDRQTFQIDATKIEPAITSRTACIMPVHLGGNAADLDVLLAIGKKHSIPVVEDACQAHLGEWKGKKVGSWGTTGCFSFQASKNLNSGEGGAVLTNDSALYEKCYAFHNNGTSRAGRRSTAGYAYGGANLRMTEFQASLLVTQMARLEEQSKTREENARYLTRQIQEIPGISPARSYPGCTRNAYHLYMFRYDPEQFAGVPRERFIKALGAEGIPCSGGYTPLNRESFLTEAIHSKGFQSIYGADRLGAYEKNNHCPENDRLCTEAVWFTQTMFIGERTDMDQIAEAIRKIHRHAAELAKA
jgi:perosamine synthetase